jgi:penicillin-binding protein 1A
MNEMFERIRQFVNLYSRKLHDWLRPVLAYVSLWFGGILVYFRTHPKARKLSLILGPPLVGFAVLLTVVLIDTPSNSELSRIQNQVA